MKYTGDREGFLAAERKLLIKESPRHGIEVSQVVWGRELNRAVRGSVNSIFGTMAFPDVTLAVPAEAEKKPLMTGQPQWT